jgi:hypothetical protein
MMKGAGTDLGCKYPKSHMNASESIPGPLRELAEAFEACALWAVRAILECDVIVKAPFEVLPSIPGGSSLYCILPAASDSFYAQMVVGVAETDLVALFPGEPEEKIRKDAVGELANVISGLFLADERFIRGFGYLKPSTPFFSEGAFTAREDWSLKGCLEANGREITLQLSVRELGKPSKEVADGKTPEDSAFKTKGGPD